MNLRSDFQTIHHFIFLCIIVTFCAVIYSNNLDGPFIFDDLDSIQNNQYIKLTELNITGLFDAAFKSPLSARPVSNISFALNYYFGQYNVFGYHLVNIIIHLINGLLAYFVTLLTLKRLASIENPAESSTSEFSIALISLFTACIFIAHPVQVQSVSYLVQRMNSLAAMFYFLSLLFYILGRCSKLPDRRRLLWLGCLCSGLLALGSKQNAATLPLIIVLYEWYFFQDLNKQWIRQNIKYMAALLGILLVISIMYLGDNPIDRILSDYHHRDFSIGERILTQFRVVVFYITLVVFPYPDRLNLLHDIQISSSFFVPPTTILSFFILGGLIWLAIYTARRERLISFCIFWFFINLIIESSVIGLELIFEHRLYIPLFSFALVFSYVLFRYLSDQLKLFVTCTIVLSITLGIGTYKRNETWRNDLVLWTDVVNKSPDSYRAHLNLGFVFAQHGNLVDAVKHYHKAIYINPYSSRAHNNLGAVLKELGRLDEGIKHYLIALKNNPSNSSAHYNLGIAFNDKGIYSRAINHYLKAIQIDPFYTKAHFNLGNTFAREGNMEMAVNYYRKAIEQDSDSAEFYNNLGIALLNMGKINEAITQFTEAIEIDPQFAHVYLNLGKAQLLTGNKKFACNNFQKVLQIDPELPDTRQLLYKHCVVQAK